MLKLKFKGKNALATLRAGNIGDILGGELKTKKHSMKVGFNTPENPGLTAEAAFYPGGITCQNLTAELEAKFADACILDKAAMQAADPKIKSVNDFFHFYA
jgi:hypothetical protein